MKWATCTRAYLGIVLEFREFRQHKEKCISKVSLHYISFEPRRIQLLLLRVVLVAFYLLTERIEHIKSVPRLDWVSKSSYRNS